MMRSKRFEPIQELASDSADKLSRSMADAARRVADLERQFEQLKTYRDEYVSKSTGGTGGAMDGLKLQNYRSFIDRLGEAIRQHVTKLDTARAEYERRRTLWSEKRIEAESLSRVIDRFREEELHVAERREQREGDDYAARMSLDRAEASKLN
jgi:flagellar FliJ protein